MVALAHKRPEQERDGARDAPPLAAGPERAHRRPRDPARRPAQKIYPDVPDELLRARRSEDEEQLEADPLVACARRCDPDPRRRADARRADLVTADSGRRFSDDDFLFAQDMRCAPPPPIQNARLYEEQVRVAHTLQASLLPERLPETARAGAVRRPTRRASRAPRWVATSTHPPAGEGRHLVFLGDCDRQGDRGRRADLAGPPSVRTAARSTRAPRRFSRSSTTSWSSQPRLSAGHARLRADRRPAHDRPRRAGPPAAAATPRGQGSEVGPTGILLGAVGARTFREEAVELRTATRCCSTPTASPTRPGERDRFGHVRLIEILTAAGAEPAAVLERIEDALREFQTGSAVGRSGDPRAALRRRADSGAQDHATKPILRST
jgi:hypothetical protein